MRNVGTIGFGYLELHNFVSLPLKKYHFGKVYDPFKITAHLYQRIAKKRHPIFTNMHYDFGINRFHLLHFFGTISFGNTPWFVTFEEFVPRWAIYTHRGLDMGMKFLADNECKQIIAMSNHAYNYQIRGMEEFCPIYKDDIIPKMTVRHPFQPTIVESYDHKSLSKDKIVFTLVGHDFFRKGGKEILKVFDDLLSKGYPLRLNIISKMQYGDYVSKTERKDLDEAYFIIEKYPHDIVHYPVLRHKEVLKLLTESNVGLLPTYDDTFGFSVLEAQACGCPVITTNIKALPEINDEQCGWLIEVPKDKWGKARLFTDLDVKSFSGTIQEQLHAIMMSILHQPDIIRKKGSVALEKVRTNYAPEDAANYLETLYDEALK